MANGNELFKLSALIEALQIFQKYGDPSFPTHCEHDILLMCVEEDYITSEEDVDRLRELGFSYKEDREAWGSYRFGSC